MNDADWFADLYQAGYRHLVMVVFARTRDLAEAEEIAQEAYERGYARCARLRRADNPQAWLCTVALNVLRRRMRRRSTASRLGRTDESDRPAPAVPVDDALDLQRALAELSTEFREALVLHYLADLPIQAIAAFIEVPEGTVKSRLARGRKLLAQRLGDTGRADDAQPSTGKDIRRV